MIVTPFTSVQERRRDKIQAGSQARQLESEIDFHRLGFGLAKKSKEATKTKRLLIRHQIGVANAGQSFRPLNCYVPTASFIHKSHFPGFFARKDSSVGKV